MRLTNLSNGMLAKFDVSALTPATRQVSFLTIAAIIEIPTVCHHVPVFFVTLDSTPEHKKPLVRLVLPTSSIMSKKKNMFMACHLFEFPSSPTATLSFKHGHTPLGRRQRACPSQECAAETSAATS